MLVTRVVYYLLVALCIGISSYLTYFGFQRTFLGLTPLFTAVIGLLLFLADYLMQRNRERGDPWMPAFLLFVVAAFFSGTSNFNYLYTNFMTKDVLTTTMREQYVVFQDDLNATSAKLGGLDTVRDEVNLRNRVETELEQLLAQMNDPGRPGCGERCEQHIATINALVGVPLTDIARPGTAASITDRQAFYDTIRELALQALDNRPDAQGYKAVQALRGRIAERLRFYDTADNAINAGADLSLLANLSQESIDFERQANLLLPSDAAVNHTYIDPTLGRLGEIVYSLRNGLIERPNLGATILALILSVVVDIIPVFVAFVAFRPGESATISTSSDHDVFS